MITERAALDRIKEIATERAGTFRSMGHLNVASNWEEVLEIIEQAQGREWPTLLDVPADVKRVTDSDGDKWFRTHSGGWQQGLDRCGNEPLCREGHPRFGPFREER